MTERSKLFKLWPRQLQAFTSPATEILYGGAAGPGKSHLLRAAFITWAAAISGLQIYLFRRKYRDLIQGHVEGPTGFKAMLYEAEKAGLVEIVQLEIRFKNGPGGDFEGGSRISLNHCQHEKNVYDYKSIEFHVLGIEETTEFTEPMIRFLRSRVRMPSAIKVPDEFRIPVEFWGNPGKPEYSFPRALYATNPGGEGHAYLKKYFVDPSKGDGIWRAPDSEGGMLRQFIRARLTDNPSVNPEEYARKLQGLGSPAYVKALLDGDWNAPVGGFFTEFDVERHVLPNFIPPKHWFRFRTYDWGSSAPSAVYWWAVSDGAGIPDLGGRSLPRGALVAYREWYICNEHDFAKGIGMRNEDVANGILIRSPEQNEKAVATLTDSLPFQDRGGKTIAETFASCGVILTEGDTSRIPGWSQMRSRLKGNDMGSYLYFVQDCEHAIRTIPMLQHDPLDPEEVIGNEDHAPDAIRLACMARPRTVDLDPPPLNTATLKNELTFMQAIERVQRVKARSNGSW